MFRDAFIHFTPSFTLAHYALSFNPYVFVWYSVPFLCVNNDHVNTAAPEQFVSLSKDFLILTKNIF